MKINTKSVIKYIIFSLLFYFVFQGIWAFTVWHRNMREMEFYKNKTIELVASGELKVEDLDKELDDQRTYFVMKAGAMNAQGFVVNGFVRAAIFNPCFIIINHGVFRPIDHGF